MNSHRGLFAAGLVLGLGTGLILGHFLRPSHSAISTATPRFELGRPALAAMLPESPGTLGPLAMVPDFREFNTTFDAADEDLLQSPPPLQNALAVETEPLQQGASQLMPTQFPREENDEPAQLNVGEAAPLAKNGSREQQTIRGIIDIELSHLPAEKREVWFDALKDVNKEDVAGILRMWKLLGGPIPDAPANGPLLSDVAAQKDSHEKSPESEAASPSLLQPQSPPGPAPDVAKLPEDPRWELLLQAEEILRQDLFLQETPGSIPRVPIFTRSSAGKWALTVQEDFASVRLVATGFPLDLAIQGPGFFIVVAEDGTQYFTRRGNFTLDRQRRLTLPDGKRLLTLQSEIFIPQEDAMPIPTIDSRGEVALIRRDEDGENARLIRSVLGQIPLAWIWQSHDLQAAGNGLYVLPEGKQDHWSSIPLPNTETRVLQGMIEYPARPQVDLQNHLLRLRQSLAR